MVIFGMLQYFKDSKAKQKRPVSGLAHVITTNVEHDAVILPIKHLQSEGLIGTYVFIYICITQQMTIFSVQKL